MILQANKDSDDEVALEACEFWYVFSKRVYAAQRMHLGIYIDYLDLSYISSTNGAHTVTRPTYNNLINYWSNF